MREATRHRVQIRRWQRGAGNGRSSSWAEHASKHCLFVVAIKSQVLLNPTGSWLGGLERSRWLRTRLGEGSIVDVVLHGEGGYESSLSPLFRDATRARRFARASALLSSSSSCCERDVAESDSDSQIDS